MSQSSSRFHVSSVKWGEAIVIVGVTISHCLFVFIQSHAKVSASFTNVSRLAVAAFDLIYFSLSVLRFVFALDINKESL